MENLRRKIKNHKAIFGVSIFILVLVIIAIIFILTRLAQKDKDPVYNTEDTASYPTSMTKPVSTVSYSVVPPTPTPPPSIIIEGLPNPNLSNLEAEIKVAPQNDYVNAISEFYKHLRDKNFEGAHKIGSQGRSVETLRSLYSEYSNIEIFYTAVGLSENQYLLGVKLSKGNNFEIYSVTLNMSENSEGKKIIASSRSDKVEEFFLTCHLDDSEKTVCLVRDWETGKIVRIDSIYIGRFSLPTLSLAKRVGNIQYLIGGYGEWRTTDYVYAYDLETKNITFVDYLVYSATEIKYNSSCPAGLDRSKNKANLSSYQEGGCLYSHRDEIWFKNNKYYLENFDKYY